MILWGQEIKPIKGMFKGCFISKCKIENYRCETSKIYTVTQPDSIQEKLGSYLFMQSFVQDCIIRGGCCPGSSILLSHFYNCNIIGLDAHGMDFWQIRSTSLIMMKSGVGYGDCVL